MDSQTQNTLTSLLKNFITTFLNKEKAASKGKGKIKLNEKREKNGTVDTLEQEENRFFHAYFDSSANTMVDFSSRDFCHQNLQYETEIYNAYFRIPRKENTRFMIYPYKQKILNLLGRNQVIIISGPTGCGKTTQVPQYILDWHAQRKLHCNIIVTQPRRLGAVTITKRVCEERMWPVGSLCGYKIGLKDLTSEDTRLTYVTIGVFLQMLINQQNLSEFSHVIIDEIHEREQSMDFSLLIIKHLLATNSRNVKLILMSATANVGKFSKYFEQRIKDFFIPAPIIPVRALSKYEVEIYYLEELAPLGELPDVRSTNPRVSEYAMQFCVQLIQQFDRLDYSLKNKKAVLIFLPGIYEIELMYSKLVDVKCRSCGEESNWYPVPLHSSITVEEQAQAFRVAPEGLRKIILATNIAESSITVPDVMFVIDFCLTKLLMTDPQTNLTRLETCWASKANLTQRSGRVGRVMPGKVYRMIPLKFMEHNIIKDQNAPDMMRCPLEKITLQAKLLNMGDPVTVLSKALDAPDLADLERTILVLKEAGAILLGRNSRRKALDGEMSYLGILMAKLPVDIHLTRLIVLGYAYSCLKEAIIMAAAMSVKSVFANPFQEKIKAYASRLAWANGTCSDCISFLNVYEVWKSHHARGYFGRIPGDNEAEWAKEHYIQLRALKEVDLLVEELTCRLKCLNIEDTKGPGSVEWTGVEREYVLKLLIAGTFYPNYFTRRGVNGREMEEMGVRILNGMDPLSTVYFTNFPSEHPIELYKHMIKIGMGDCGEDVRISNDMSKIFVEFPRTRRDWPSEQMNRDMPFSARIPGDIPMVLYKTAKIKFICRQLEIKVLPLREAWDIERRRLEQEAAITQPPDPRIKLHTCLLPGIGATSMSVKITHIVDPNCFYCVALDYQTRENVRDMLFMLNTPKAEYEPFLYPPEVGEICVAAKSSDLLFLRAKILDVYEYERRRGQNFDWCAKVFFIDEGTIEIVMKKNMLRFTRRYASEILQIPALAFECTLTGVRPSPFKSAVGLWTPEAINEFRNLAGTDDLFANIFSVVDGVVSVVLHKSVIAENGVPFNLNVNDHMVELGYGEQCDEKLLSMKNNEMRLYRQADSTPIQENEIWELKKSWAPCRTYRIFELNGRERSLKLRGPFTAVEMYLYSLTRGSSGFIITIAHNSVNSTLLDPHLEDDFERLFVASYVSQNHNSERVILNETTLMPNIRGLAALVPFLYAPTVEMRVDKRRTRYTGVLCGLGVDKDGAAIFPEHDMEVVFDSEFTEDDFIEINRLRFFTSLLLIPELHREGFVSSYGDKLTCQRAISDSIKKLLFKKRAKKRPEHPLQHHEWGITKMNWSMNKNFTTAYNAKSIFPLLKGVRINCIQDEKKMKRQHLAHLHHLAANRTEFWEPLECEVCEMHLADIKELRIHLSTDGHQEKEDALLHDINRGIV